MYSKGDAEMTNQSYEIGNERNIYGKCTKYMYHHVMFTMNNGSSFDGIVESVEPDRITVLVGEDTQDPGSLDLANRQYNGYDNDNDDYGYGYGRPRRRYRRFRRQVLPLATIAALSLLPYISPYPYYPPYYPYY
jgi:hypothetical protein